MDSLLRSRKFQNPYPARKRTKLLPLAGSVVQPGKPLIYPVYRKDGSLLAEKGTTLSPEQADHLLQEEIFTDDFELASAVSEGKPTNAFQRADDYKFPSVFERMVQIEDILLEVYTSPLHPANKSKILTAMTRLQNLCATSPDAAIAKIFTDDKRRYTIQHSLHTAILCELVANYLNWSKDSIRLTTAAALTMNVALGLMQDELQNQAEPLSTEQKIKIKEHPTESAKMLGHMGIKDNTWLEMVRKHHESVDGKGYPDNLGADDIPLGASLINLADIYCAKITGRSYRKPVFPNVAARDIFLSREGHPFGTMIEVFVKVVGLYPPGVVVKLANDETALVIRRTPRVDAPLVRPVTNSQGIVLQGMPLRPTDTKTHRIVDVVAPEQIGTTIEYAKYWS